MKQSKWMVIANPKAGGGRMLKDWPLISDWMSKTGIDFDMAFTNHKYHAVELTVSAIRNGYVNFIAIGGDGTMNEVVNGIFVQKERPVSDMTLAVIPGGSGNDLIKMLNIGRDYRSAALAISEGRTSRLDVVRFRLSEARVEKIRYMVNVGGVGFDAMVCHYCNKLKENGSRGQYVYVKGAARALLNHRSKDYRIKIDDQVFYSGKVFSLAFGNGKYSGGGMLQTPNAIPDDGLVDVTVIKKCPTWRVLKEFKKLFSGNILDIKGFVLSGRGRKIDIETIVEDRVEIDGEVVGTTPISLEVMPQTLNVIVGGKSR